MKQFLKGCVLGFAVLCASSACAASNDQQTQNGTTTDKNGCRVETRVECEEIPVPCPPCCPEDDTCGKRCEKPKCPPKPKCEKPRCEKPCN